MIYHQSSVSAPSVRTRAGRKTSRQALELLAKSADGYAEAALLAYGFNPDLLAGLVHAGFADLHMDRVRAGAGWFEVRRLQISEAGRQALGRG